ncbi:MAG: phosphoribosylaminoimidazolesuccinocarboxamide synthase [Methanocellales archaeon]|nr:phosphoribosylaminoimidazolesuccinocarboxamide synthase [Methanocellales archaeon]
MGSVKDLEIMKPPTKGDMGVARFHFSDRYSVFDWGEMPDLIENKGEALCMMGAYCFEELEKRGIKTHYKGLVSPNGKLVTTMELEEPISVMEISLVRVFKPEFHGGAYNYDIFAKLAENDEGNFLLPLEVIYRNALPPGSSIFRRLKKGEITYQDLGLDYYPKPEEKLKTPIFEVSTKLEERDRYITWSEAQRMSGMRDDEIAEAKEILLHADNLITEIAAKADLKNEDGKIELALDPDRRLMVVDVIGTLDECRFTYKGLHVSKEIARQFYKNTKWSQDVEEAKREADAKGLKDWKGLCRSQPPKLDPGLREIVGRMYMAAANEFTGLNLFDVHDLGEVVEEYESYLKKING